MTTRKPTAERRPHLTLALSSRALFDFEKENRVWEKHGQAAYDRLQLKLADVPPPPGVAFALVQKLLRFNAPGAQQLVEVALLSRTSAPAALRVCNAIQYYELGMSSGISTAGSHANPYIVPLRANLFLSAHEKDVRRAIEAGNPAARVLPHSKGNVDANRNEVRIAFDGDAVLFSDEAEQVYQANKSLTEFDAHEQAKARVPLPDGPMKPLLLAFNALGKAAAKDPSLPKLRIALITARSLRAHQRALRTLLGWGMPLQEVMFLSGRPKGPFLQTFGADFFFDDHKKHCESGASVTAVGHVPSGINNPNPAP